MSNLAITFIIIGVCYFLAVSATVFSYFANRANPKEREFWTILFTWIIALIFGPFILLCAGISVARQAFKRRKK